MALAALLIGQMVLLYTKTPEMSQGFQYMRNFGKLVLPAALILLFVPFKFQLKFRFVFLLASLVMFSGSVFSFTQNKYVFEQIVEHSLKFGLPVVYAFQDRLKSKSFVFTLKLLTAFTFIGHGLFAVGLHFVPGGFLQMTQNILGFGVEGSHTFLFIVGIMDFIVAIALFMKPLQLPAMVYMVFWGALTSLARFVGYYYHAPLEEVYGVYLFETIWRAPHFMAPILLLSLYVRGVSFSLSKKFFSNPSEVLSH